MNKTNVKNQLEYLVAIEQYLKPLLENGLISESAYNEASQNLYDSLRLWQGNSIRRKEHKINKKKEIAAIPLDYVSLTELAREYNREMPAYVIQSWMRDGNTINFLTLWEQKHNNKFTEGAVFFKTTITSKLWIERTNAIGIMSYRGKNGGTYVNKALALHFMCHVSPDFMLKVIEKYMEVTENEKNN